MVNTTTPILSYIGIIPCMSAHYTWWLILTSCEQSSEPCTEMLGSYIERLEIRLCEKHFGPSKGRTCVSDVENV